MNLGIWLSTSALRCSNPPAQTRNQPKWLPYAKPEWKPKQDAAKKSTEKQSSSEKNSNCWKLTAAEKLNSTKNKSPECAKIWICLNRTFLYLKSRMRSFKTGFLSSLLPLLITSRCSLCSRVSSRTMRNLLIPPRRWLRTTCSCLTIWVFQRRLLLSRMWSLRGFSRWLKLCSSSSRMGSSLRCQSKLPTLRGPNRAPPPVTMKPRGPRRT